MGHKFPEVERGGSLILAWRVQNKRVLVVGGGEVRHTCTERLEYYADIYGQVAAGRILNLLNADANVLVISPREGLNDEVAYRIDQKQVDYKDRKFEPSDLDDPDLSMVLTAVDDAEASSRIWKLCKEKRIAANIADVPPECDFYFGSVHRDGPLQIMVSTNGNGPKMASILRKRIAQQLPPNIGAAIKKVGMLRKMLRGVAPGNEEGPKRMQWWADMQCPGDEDCTDSCTGCPRCVSSGLWRIFATWKSETWKFCCNHMRPTSSRAWNKYAWEKKTEYGHSMALLASLYEISTVDELRSISKRNV